MRVSVLPAAPLPPSSTLLTRCLGHALISAPTLRPVVPLMAETEPVQALAMAAALLHRGHGKVVRCHTAAWHSLPPTTASALSRSDGTPRRSDGTPRRTLIAALCRILMTEPC